MTNTVLMGQSYRTFIELLEDGYAASSNRNYFDYDRVTGPQEYYDAVSRMEGHYYPSPHMLQLAIDARRRYERMQGPLLRDLRDAFVEVALQQGHSQETYWLYRENVSAIDSILLSR